jgi:hypothetical protein
MKEDALLKQENLIDEWARFLLPIVLLFYHILNFFLQKNGIINRFLFYF